MFEKEAEDKAFEEAQKRAAEKAAQATRERPKQDVEHANKTVKDGNKSSDVTSITSKKEVVVAHWDPELYRSKLWPLICLFGASFGALHLISWSTAFPTKVEAWLWRGSALVSIFSMLIFIHFEKVIFR